MTPSRDSGTRETEQEWSVLSAGASWFSPQALAALGLRYWRPILALAAAFALVVGVRALFKPRTYSSDSSFIPQIRKSPSEPSGIAAQFGLAVPAGDPTQTPAFYADLLTSRDIIRAAVETKYRVPTPENPNQQITLVDHYAPSGGREDVRREVASTKLAQNITTRVAPKTSVVRLTVVGESPSLAAQINQRLLRLVTEFNVTTRQSQAAAERHFTELRLNAVRNELTAAEFRLQDFLQRNRDYAGSPQLRFQQDRLARQISFQQQIYGTLAQALEQAKIDEVRDTPVITVLEPPNLPVRPNARGTVSKTVTAFFFGIILAYFGFVARNVFYSMRLARRSLPESSVARPSALRRWGGMTHSATSTLGVEQSKAHAKIARFDDSVDG